VSLSWLLGIFRFPGGLKELQFLRDSGRDRTDQTVPFETIGQLSALPVNILQFRFIASFWNHSTSKATGVENRGEITTFHSCKNQRTHGRNV